MAALFSAVVLAFGFGVSDPEITRWAALHVFAAFACLFLVRGCDFPRAAWLGIAFFVWCGVSLVWSVDWRGGAVELANGAGLLAAFLVGACADRRTLDHIASWVGPSLIVGAAVLCFAFPQWFGGFGNENFQVEAFIALVPFVFLARGKVQIWLALFAGILAAYFIATTLSNLKWLIVGGWGLLFLAGVWRCGFRWGASIIGAGGLVIALATGIVGADMFGSVLARTEIALNTLAMWSASPIWGNGLGSFNPLYPNYQERHLVLMPSGGSVFGADMSYFAGAAHNEFAQVLSDFGLIGASILGCLVWVLVRSERRDRLDLVCAASLFNLAVLSLVEFPFQNPHTAVIGAICAGALLNGHHVVRIGWTAVVPAGVVVACMAWVGVLTFNAHRWFSVTETVNATDPYSGLLANFYAYQEFPWPRHIRHQLAVSLNAAIEKDPDSIRIDAASADKLYEVAFTAAGPATAIEMGRIEYLLMAGRWQERREEIEARLSWLRANASNHAVVWLMEGKWALLIGDKPRAMAAVEHGQAIPKTMLNYRNYMQTIYMAARAED